MARFALLLISLFSLCFFVVCDVDVIVSMEYQEVTVEGIALRSIIANLQDETNSPQSPVIHIRQGERFRAFLRVGPFLSEGSLHWHGFELRNGTGGNDGAVGVTQCGVLSGSEMVYDFVVEETPGSYWYHSLSQSVPGLHNLVRGPLIVHPSMGTVMDSLDDLTEPRGFSYGQERVVFLSDVMMRADHDSLLSNTGGITPQGTRTYKGNVVGTQEWRAGLINGRDQESLNSTEIFSVRSGELYLFRFISGAKVFPFVVRLNGGDLPLQVVASDGTEFEDPMNEESMTFSHLMLFPGETYDALVQIPAGLETISLEVTTNEAITEPHGMFANIAVEQPPPSPSPSSSPSPSDPLNPFARRTRKQPTSRICSSSSSCSSPSFTCLNCYNNEHGLSEDVSCVSASSLPPPSRSSTNLIYFDDDYDYEFHSIDMKFSPPPTFAHFISIDGEIWIQNTNPRGPLIGLESDSVDLVHPHTIVLDIDVGGYVVFLLRTMTLFSHPMHLVFLFLFLFLFFFVFLLFLQSFFILIISYPLSSPNPLFQHGHKFEVLEIISPNTEKDCSNFGCPLLNVDVDNIVQLNPPGSVPLKSTVVVPAGGAVVIRIFADNPGSWVFRCDIDQHFENGLGLIVREGDVSSVTPGGLVPESGCPKKERVDIANCRCFDDPDRFSRFRFEDPHNCSRIHLCRHDRPNSLPDNLIFQEDRFHIPGPEQFTQAEGWKLGLTIFCLLLPCFVISAVQKYLFYAYKDYTEESKDVSKAPDVYETSFVEEFKVEWMRASTEALNNARYVEVFGLGLITGLVFLNVTEEYSNGDVAQAVSFLFFSMTLWTFPRLYPSVATTVLWVQRLRKRFGPKERTMPRRSLKFAWAVTRVCLARVCVYILSEGWAPLAYGAVAFPLAGFTEDPTVWVTNISFYLMNNYCFITFGAIIGTLFEYNLSVAMIASTLYAQSCMVCAGFFRTLPDFLSWYRNLCFLYWTFSGVMKNTFTAEDTIQCAVGDARMGYISCSLEAAGVMDTFKKRGIEAAVSDDLNSDRSWVPSLVLVAYYMGGVGLFCLCVIYRMGMVTKREKKRSKDEKDIIAQFVEFE